MCHLKLLRSFCFHQSTALVQYLGSASVTVTMQERSATLTRMCVATSRRVPMERHAATLVTTPTTVTVRLASRGSTVTRTLMTVPPAPARMALLAL